MRTRRSIGLIFGIFLTVIAGCIWPFVAVSSLAQASHVEQFQSIAIECLGDVPAELDAFELSGPDRMPFIRTGLIGFWLAQKKSVYDGIEEVNGADSTHLALLRYDIERAGVEYGKSSSGFIERNVYMALRYELNGPDGEVLSISTCDRSLSDTLSTNLAKLYNDDRFSETNVEPENRSWLKKVIQPAVVIGAAALGTALFFNLRSDRADGG